MKKMFYSWATLTLLVVLAGFVYAQPTAVIQIKGYSLQELTDMGWTSPRSTGLSNVGVNQLVYLLGNSGVTTWQWSLTAKPAGSNAVLDSTNKRQTTFKPDVVGQFTVQLVVTDASGTSAPVSVTINSAKFVGVGLMDGLPIDINAGQCGLCHNTNFNQWTTTGHSSMLKRGIDGVLSDHYSEACIECHTTGYDLDANGNDGFDDVQKEVGWTFPTTLQAGNYDALLNQYPKLAHRANVQCESCHGPGSQHKGVKANIAMSLDASVCGYCHEEGRHIKNTQWKKSLHAVGVSFASTNPSCAGCHSGYGFIDRVDNKAELRTGFQQTSCAVCHDPHSAANEHQVRKADDVTLKNGEVVSFGGIGKLCMNCHMAREDAVTYATEWHSRFGPHHNPQTDMLAGTNAITFGKTIPSSNHRYYVPEACVTCHMSPTPAAGQPGQNLIGEHTWAMEAVDDNGTPNDPSDDVEVQNVSACRNCHGPINSFADIKAKEDYDGDGNIESAQDEVRGLHDELGKQLPPLGDPAVAIETAPTVDPNYTPVQLLAAYNYMFVLEDQSWGVHNFQYTINLLKSSIAALTTGDIGAGMITGITDVPNDQGKQVRVAWMRFPGDGVAANPITRYSLWRRADDNMSGVAAIKVASRGAMFAQASKNNVGKRFTVAQEGSWDFVAEIPAAGYAYYSTVAPTIFDSTAAGMHWSYFFVAGHAAQGQIFESAPDSGYSVDNLAPFTPSNVVASLLADKKTVGLQWDDPVDEDFQYFAVYRSTTPGFDPKGTEPLATLIGTNYTDTGVATGSQYYYRISAYDFAGNESKYSPELNVFVTSVAERGGGVPTEYALEQNYPNPFNPETTIRYQLPTSSHVRLSIYTALGQEIRVLVDNTQSAAYHVVVWDGRDIAGNPMPSGVYFYRLETEKFTSIKKMVMMK